MPRLTNSVVAAGTLTRLAQPVLQADGFVLRAWQPEDAPAVVAAYSDPDIQQWHARSMTENEALDWIASWRQRWQQETGCGWAAASDEGVLGLHRIEVDHSTRNTASCRVAERAGYRVEGTKRSQALHADGWHDMHQHARIATDPAQLNAGITSRSNSSMPDRS